MAAVGRSWGGEWRQLYLNINKKRELLLQPHSLPEIAPEPKRAQLMLPPLAPSLHFSLKSVSMSWGED